MRSFVRRSLVVSMIALGLLSIWVVLRVVLRKPPEIPGTLAVIETEAQVYVGVFGNSLLVAPVGDLDGDGKVEIAVGNSLTSDKRGSVEVFGTTGRRLHAWQGPPDWRLGTEVRTLGDLDQDGIPDLGLSEWSPREDGTRVRVVLSAGGRGAVPPKVSLLAKPRFHLRVFADLDGDGIQDVAAPVNDGRRLHVLNGSSGRAWTLEFAEPIRRAAGRPQSWEEFAGIADLNGDQVDELAVSSYRSSGDDELDDQLCKAWIVSGSDGTIVHEIDAPTGIVQFGDWLNPVCDVDGDGVEDLAIGGDGFAGLWSPGSKVWLWQVASRATSWAHIIPSGDIDADGREDLLALEAGSVTVLTASTGQAIAQLIDGRVAFGSISRGPHAAGVGDVDRDGHGDLAISFPAVLSSDFDVAELAVPPLSYVLIVSGAEFMKHYAVGP